MLTNFDLEIACKKYGIPLVECCSKDELHGTPKQGGYIINLSDHDKEGSHWTTFYIEKNKSAYYDSFGFPEPQSVKKFLHNFRPIAYNHKEIQSIITSDCGYYCLYVLWFMSHHKNIEFYKRFDKCISMFSNDVTHNRKILGSLLKPIHPVEIQGEGIDFHTVKRKYNNTVKDVKRKFKNTVKDIKNSVKDVEDVVGKTFEKRDSSKLPPNVRNFLQQHGNEKITSMTLVRTPVSSFLKHALNIVSLGAFQNAIHDTGYNDIFHLSLYINNRYTLDKPRNRILLHTQ